MQATSIITPQVVAAHKAYLKEEEDWFLRDAYPFEGNPASGLVDFAAGFHAGVKAEADKTRPPRSPQDFAIEFAEYMAIAGEHLRRAVNVLASAEENKEATDEIDDAQEAVNEAMTGLRRAIYEFRKRAHKARPIPPAPS